MKRILLTICAALLAAANLYAGGPIFGGGGGASTNGLASMAYVDNATNNINVVTFNRVARLVLGVNTNSFDVPVPYLTNGARQVRVDWFLPAYTNAAAACSVLVGCNHDTSGNKYQGSGERIGNYGGGSYLSVAWTAGFPLDLSSGTVDVRSNGPSTHVVLIVDQSQTRTEAQWVMRSYAAGASGTRETFVGNSFYNITPNTTNLHIYTSSGAAWSSNSIADVSVRY